MKLEGMHHSTMMTVDARMNVGLLTSLTDPRRARRAKR